MKRLIILRNILLKQPVQVPPGHVRVRVTGKMVTFDEFNGPQRIPQNHFDVVPEAKANALIQAGLALAAPDEFIHAARGKTFDVADDEAQTLLAEGAAEPA